MFLLQILCSYILSFKISYFKYVYSGDILELICPIHTILLLHNFYLKNLQLHLSVLHIYVSTYRKSDYTSTQ